MRAAARLGQAARTTLVVLWPLLMTASPGAAQPLSPLVVDWDRFFRVQTDAAMRDGRAAATIWNTSDWEATRIQLLVEALDASGQPVSQRVVWLGSRLPAAAHASVEIPTPAAASHRVRVFAFDLELTAGPR